MNLTFDDSTHTYRIDGVAVPSVTQVLQLAGLSDPSKYPPGAAERGTYVHIGTALYDRDDLNEDVLDDDKRGYIAAWAKFRADSEFEIDAIEARRCSETRRFAGTIDRLGIWNGWHTIIDIKSGQPEPWHALQTMGYAILIGGATMERYAVYLRPNGSYKLVCHKEESDRGVFLGALSVAQFKIKNGDYDANRYHYSAA